MRAFMQDNKPVVISTVTFNRLKYFKTQSKSILSQDHDLFKWVIVDNNSTDGTMDYVIQLKMTHPELIKAYLMRENIGAAKAHNLTLLQRNINQYWMQFDPDIRIKNANWLQSFYSQMVHNPQIGVLGVSRRAQKPYELNIPVETRCMMFQPNAIKQLGFYDECYGLCGFSGDSLVYRLSKLKFKSGNLFADIVHLNEKSADTEDYLELKNYEKSECLEIWYSQLYKINKNMRNMYSDTSMLNYDQYIEL
jgi:glycosyltransferase involved in cell wall biosynthesis